MRLFHSPLRLSIFYGSRDQLRPGSFLQKREEPGNEVGIIFNEVETNDLCMTSETQSNIKQSSSIFWLLQFAWLPDHHTLTLLIDRLYTATVHCLRSHLHIVYLHLKYNSNFKPPIDVQMFYIVIVTQNWIGCLK